MRRVRNIALLSTLLALACPRAHAVSLNPRSFLSVTDKTISDLVGLVGLGFDLRAYEGVRPYSTLTGFDLGASLSAIIMPPDVVKALTDLGIPNVPHYLPAPKINVQKGFNNRLFIGSEFIPSIKIQGSTVSVYGFDAQWTLIDRPRLPPVSIRGQFNYADLVYARAATFGADAVIGWNLVLVDLYGGGGYRYVRGSVSNPTESTPVALNVNFSPSLDAGHFFAGIAVVAGIFRITTEANLTTRGVNTYGTKFSAFF